MCVCACIHIHMNMCVFVCVCAYACVKMCMRAWRITTRESSDWKRGKGGEVLLFVDLLPLLAYCFWAVPVCVWVLCMHVCMWEKGEDIHILGLLPVPPPSGKGNSSAVFELCLYVCVCYVSVCMCVLRMYVCVWERESYSFRWSTPSTRQFFLSCVCVCMCCVYCVYAKKRKVILFVDLLLLLAYSFWALPVCVCVCVCVVCVCERDRQFSSFRSSTPFSLRWVLSCACVCVCVLWICVCVRKERLFFPSISSVYSPLICKRCICVMYMCVCVREKRLFLCACVWERRGYSFCWSTWLARLSQIFSKEKASKKIFVYIRGE